MSPFKSPHGKKYQVLLLFTILFLFNQPHLFGQAGWNLYPGKQFSFTAVQAVHKDTIYASGNNSSRTSSVIIRTYDGFLTTDTLFLPFGISDFRFFDAQNAVVGELDRGIHITTDGGLTWIQRGPVFINDPVKKIAICHPDTVYLGTKNGTIYKTVDGGQNWNSFSLPNPNSQYSGARLKNLEFTNSMVGYASIFYFSGPHKNPIYKTIDGGQNWMELNSALGTDRSGSLRISHPDTLLHCASGHPFKYSTDGGMTWDSLQSSHPLHSNSHPFDFEENALKFTTGGDIYRHRGIGVWKGNLWSQDSTVFDYPYCSNIKALDVVGNNVVMVGDKSGISTAFGGSNQTNLISLAQQYYGDIHFFDSLNGLSSNHPNARGVSKTSDGGKTWKMTCVGMPYLSEFAFWDDLKGLLAGAGGVLITTDGGLTWNNPVSVTSFYGKRTATWASSSHAYAAEDGAVMKTVDGGSNWYNLPIIADVQLALDIDFTSQDTGFVIVKRSNSLNSYAILKTNDGGLTWSENYSHDALIKGKIQSLHFPSKLVGYAVGSINLTLKTTDGGNSWNQLNTISHSQSWKEVEFQSELEGFRCGIHGIQLTLDGGMSWRSALTGQGEVAQLSIPDLRHAYAAGNDILFSRVPGPISAMPTTPVGRQGSHLQSILQVFPNPTQNELHLRAELERGGSFRCDLYDLQGKTLLSRSGVSQQKSFQQTLSLEGISNGIYFLTLEVDGERTSQKIVVQK